MLQNSTNFFGFFGGKIYPWEKEMYHFGGKNYTTHTNLMCKTLSVPTFIFFNVFFSQYLGFSLGVSLIYFLKFFPPEKC